MNQVPWDPSLEEQGGASLRIISTETMFSHENC